MLHSSCPAHHRLDPKRRYRQTTKGPGPYRKSAAADGSSAVLTAQPSRPRHPTWRRELQGWTGPLEEPASTGPATRDWPSPPGEGLQCSSPSPPRAPLRRMRRRGRRWQLPRPRAAPPTWRPLARHLQTWSRRWEHQAAAGGAPSQAMQVSRGRQHWHWPIDPGQPSCEALTAAASVWYQRHCPWGFLALQAPQRLKGLPIPICLKRLDRYRPAVR